MIEATYVFKSLVELREVVEKWVKDYNYDKPHYALGGMSSIKYRQRKQDLKELSSASAPPSLHLVFLNHKKQINKKFKKNIFNTKGKNSIY